MERMRYRKSRRNGYVKLRTSGIVFVSAAAFVLVSAWNTGNNLLYIVLGMMVSLLMVSVISSRLTLSGVSVDRSVPATVHAGASTDIVIRVRNNKRMFHSFSLAVETGPAEQDSGAYILKVEPGNVATVVTPRTFTKRGLHRLEPTRLSTSYPFGLFEQGMLCNGHREILVYPEIRELNQSVVDRVLVRGDVVSRGGRGRGTEYYGLREYFHGDDARLISWKVSAKQGKLMLREFEKPHRKGLTLVLDTDLAGQDDADAKERFEDAVKFSASLAALCLREGYYIDLIVPGHSIDLGSGEHQLHKILRCLALIEPSEGTYETLRSELYKRGGYGKNVVSVIVTPDTRRFAGYSGVGRRSVVGFDEIGLR
jgi:uncharacterized protein (DUF58 family)